MLLISGSLGNNLRFASFLPEQCILDHFTCSLLPFWLSVTLPAIPGLTLWNNGRPKRGIIESFTGFICEELEQERACRPVCSTSDAVGRVGSFGIGRANLVTHKS